MRIEYIETMQAAPVVEKKHGVRLEDDPSANRIRLFFDGDYLWSVACARQERRRSVSVL
jgi:hypothetical protein